jgi:hypothetical protein
MRQQAMDKMLKEALAKQNAALEADRAARQSALAASSKTAPVEAKPVAIQQPPPPPPILTPTAQNLPTGPANRIVSSSGVGQPVQIAMLSSVNQQKTIQQSAQGFLTEKLPAVDDEWSYLFDSVFDGKSTIVHRVKAVAPGTGVLEEFIVNGASAGQIVFEGKPVVFGSPNGALMFAPYWSGKNGEALEITWGRCARDLTCRVKIKALGGESVQVKAGKFDAIKYEINIDADSINALPMYRFGTIELTVWYSSEYQRVIKQEIYSGSPLFKGMRGAMELVSFRAPR